MMMKRCPRPFSGVRVTEPFLVNGLIFLAPPLMKIINCDLNSNIVLIRVEQNEFLTFTNKVVRLHSVLVLNSGLVR